MPSRLDWFRRKKPAPPAKTPGTSPELDKVRAELDAVILDAAKRLAQTLERLQERERSKERVA